jgi:hypothetical protein
MLDVKVSIVLPYALRLGDGEYQTIQAGESVHVAAYPEEETRPQTSVAAIFHIDDVVHPHEIPHFRHRFADQLLRRTNRLLRWYRAVRQRADINELTRSQASPFRFEAIAGQLSEVWLRPLGYEETAPTPLPLTVEELTDRVREGLASGNDPDVDVLFLLDAERALHQGRFREAVLFCWSTIDSVFNRKYDRLIGTALVGEFAAARDFFMGVDFGLKNKMTAALYLVANRSLYREPGDFWQRLTVSYNKRNGIIHRGENANEDEARQAIAVARQVVEIMNALLVPSLAVGVPVAPRPVASASAASPLLQETGPEAVVPDQAQPGAPDPGAAAGGTTDSTSGRRPRGRRRQPPPES